MGLEEPFKLEKFIWSDADFPEMGWLDTQIWSMYADDFKTEYVLDIDYIFNWQDPPPDETVFKFWVSPSTMVFESVSRVKVQVDSEEGAIEIQSLQMEKLNIPDHPDTYSFRFECSQGEILIHAKGYRLYVRKLPSLLNAQYFTLDERKGISFARKLEGAG